MKLSDYIVFYLKNKGVNTIFGYIGGMVTHLVDSIYKNPSIKFIQVYHEQTASIAAEGYALESNNIGVAISTSGPGATNMITGIADAFFDSIPVLYITGQVNTYEYKLDRPIRQLGFQETDVVAIVKPITKYAVTIHEPSMIQYELQKAFYIAKSGRPGPVLLDIPMDIQRAEIEINKLKSYTPKNKETEKYDLTVIKELIEKAKFPLILIGGGGNNECSKKELEEFLINTRIPVVTSLKGKGAVNESIPNFLGLLGSYGNRCANMALKKVDLLIALGSRLDTRQTGAKIDDFIKNGVIIHVDIDKAELNNHRLNNRIKLHYDVLAFLKEMNALNLKIKFDEAWLTYINKLKQNYSQVCEIQRFVTNKSPYVLIEKLNACSNDATVYCVDIGQNQMWAAQTLKLRKNQKFVTSGGLAPMGYSLPSSIGISFADPFKDIISINGDGGFHIAIQSLMLISQYDLPIKVIVMNNQALGMITQFQHLYFDGKMSATISNEGYLVPKIKDIANAYNLKYYKIKESDLENSELIREIFDNRNCIIEYFIDGLTTVCPKLEFNQAIYNPSPQISIEELNNLEYENE